MNSDLLRELTLPNDVIWPQHAIQTRSGQFVVFHGGIALHDPVHCVCMISADRYHIDPLADIFFLNGWLTHQNGCLTDLIG